MSKKWKSGIKKDMRHPPVTSVINLTQILFSGFAFVFHRLYPFLFLYLLPSPPSPFLSHFCFKKFILFPSLNPFTLPSSFIIYSWSSSLSFSCSLCFPFPSPTASLSRLTEQYYSSQRVPTSRVNPRARHLPNSEGN